MIKKVKFIWIEIKIHIQNLRKLSQNRIRCFRPWHKLDKMNIKYLMYSRYSTSIPIFFVNQQQSNKTIAADADKMTSKIKALRSKANERDKLRTPYGVWYVTHDQNDIAYAVCTSEQYPERHAFGLIDKLKQKIKEINHCQYESEENIKAYTKKTAIDLASKYNDLSKIDKVHKAQSQVKQLQNELGVGIKKLINNQETLTQMQDKAQKMKSYAANFEKNSDKLEKMMYWRNMKIKIIVGLMILGLIGFVILIIVKSNQSNNSQ